MKGASMEDFIALNLTALKRSEALKKRIMSWAGNEVDWLSPEDWFVRGHDLRDGEFEENLDGLKLPILRKGTYIWTPPPAAACFALEELRKAQHKRTESTHLFVVPHLMEPYWRKHLWKVSDMIVSLPAGHEAWPS